MRADPPDFEALLSACLDDIEQHGPVALDEHCARHPECAERLRAGVARLRRLGLCGPTDGAALPERIGRYEVLARLGRGGMGVVYLARDPRDGARVALKVGQTPLERGDRSHARFEREIRAFAALSHPSIVRVLDVGEDDGRPYFAMEYVAGATLAHVIAELAARGPGSTARDVQAAAAIVREHARRVDPDGALVAHGEFGRTWIEFVCRTVHDVALALEHVHAHGIVHRDVKPANVLVRADGHALLFDLGLAHVGAEPGLTQSGDFAGTPHYVSPEQADGRVRALDGRSDVFSLGVTLYELLTLRRPFDGRGAQEILHAIGQREPTPPRRIDPALPRDLETICLTALEKDPTRRYANAAEFALDLRRFLDFQTVKARPVGFGRRAARFARRRPAASAAILLGALVVLGVPTGLAWANRAIREQRDRAEHAAIEAGRQARTSARVVQFLVDMFRVSGERPADLSAQHILDRGARRAESDFADQPLVRAALLEATGRVYQNIGQTEKALQLFDRALAIRQRELGEAHADTARTLQAVGDVHLATGDPEAARRLYERALGSLSDSGGARTLESATLRASLAAARRAARDDEGALAELVISSRLMHEIEGAPKRELAEVLAQLGGLQISAGRHAEAILSLEESLAISRLEWAPDLAARGRVIEALATAQAAAGETEVAERLRSEAALLRSDAHNRTAPSTERPPVFTGDEGARLLGAFLPTWQPDFDRAFQAGITALQSGQHASAIAAFERCRAWRPRDSVCAYNIACAHALAGDIDRGLEWLAHAAEEWFGISAERLDVAVKDADLAALRADPRSAPILARLRADAQRKPAPPIVHVGIGSPSPTGHPVLVLLHGDGMTDSAAANGPWRARADALGAALLVPAARWPISADSQGPATWVDDLPDFVKQPWAYEEPIVDALREFAETHVIDRTRVVIVGEGRGALVAFDLAARAPGLFRAVVIVDGPIHTELSAESAVPAAEAGLRVEVVVAGARPAEIDDLFRRFLARCGFQAGAVVERTDALDSATDRALGRALRAPR